MQLVAMAPLFPLLALVLLSSSCLGSEEQAAATDEPSYSVVPTSSLKYISDGAVCSGHKVMPPSASDRAWVPLNRPHGPCSATKAGAASAVVVEDMLLSDQRRANYIRAKLSNGTDGEVGMHGHESIAECTDSAMETTAAYGGGGGAAAAADPAATGGGAGGAGGGGVSQTVVIDTGSDIPWVQCAPCPSPQCHLQRDKLYDPRRSSSYAPVPCRSPACARLAAAGYGGGCSRSGLCQYTITYPDGRATAGTYVTDQFALGPNISVPGFRFGCSHAVRGKFSDRTAGILALGGGAGSSLLAQTAGLYGNAFSYCVPSPSAAGFLSMGGPVAVPASFGRTPLVRNPRNPTFYLVRLQSIAVAGRTLAVPPVVFAAGAVMDSSVVVTQLPPTAYRALRAAFRAAMRRYPLAPPRANLDTCYNFLRFPTVRVPRVDLVFAGGAVVRLATPSIMLDGCLAFAPGPSDAVVGFVGNVQQQTYEVLYDVAGRSVGFRGGAC